MEQAVLKKKVLRLIAGLSLCGMAVRAAKVEAALYRMSNVQYVYTMGGGTTSSSCNGSGNTVTCVGYLTGSFEYTYSLAGSQAFTNVQVTASNMPDYNQGGGTTQPTLLRNNFLFTSGFAGSFDPKGTTQRIYFYTEDSSQINSGNCNSGVVSGTGYNYCNNGMELTLAGMTNALGVINPEVVNFSGSTGNDNWCINVKDYVIGSSQNGCGSSKNNITSVTGSIYSPSPAIGLGLLPFSALLATRNRQRKTSQR